MYTYSKIYKPILSLYKKSIIMNKNIRNISLLGKINSISKLFLYTINSNTLHNVINRFNFGYQLNEIINHAMNLNSFLLQKIGSKIHFWLLHK